MKNKKLRKKFWEKFPLEKLNKLEWESLCDGCGQCCLIKLKNIETSAVHYTNISCQLFDHGSCRCKNYTSRQSIVQDCVELNPENIVDTAKWMPKTCAYRLLHEGKPLLDWHPLVSGDLTTVHKSGNSVKNSTLPEKEIPTSKWEEFITNQFCEGS